MIEMLIRASNLLHAQLSSLYKKSNMDFSKFRLDEKNSVSTDSS